MKKLLCMVFCFVALQAFSQDVYFQKPNADAKKEAIRITDAYNLELSLTGEQKLLFQQKVEEFLIRRHTIESEFSGKKKLDLLYELQQEETQEMNNIITRPQMSVYKKVKPQIQPLETVKKE